MRLAIAGIAIVLAVACGGSSRPEERRRSSNPTDVPADPAAGVAPLHDEPRQGSTGARDFPPGINAFLRAFDEAVLAGETATALTFFDPENRAVQREIGVGDAHYLAEAIGLHQAQRLAGHDVPEPAVWDPAAELAAVARIVVERVVPDEAMPGRMHALGRVELKDGRAYALDLPIFRGGLHGFEIVPPVG